MSGACATRRRSGRGLTLLEVIVAIGLLALLSGSILAFSYGLGQRRERLAIEGARLAAIDRILDRVEMVAGSATSSATPRGDTLALSGRAVWPVAPARGLPVAPADISAELRYDAEAGELRWRESAAGGTMELAAGGIEHVLLDGFEDLDAPRGARLPARVCIWLAAIEVDDGVTLSTDEDPLGGPPEDDLPLAPFDGLDDEDELPARPPDIVRAVLPLPAPPRRDAPALEPTDPANEDEDAPAFPRRDSRPGEDGGRP
ncbi:MAG: type II secretion system protein [Planctomycetota bacterium]